MTCFLVCAGFISSPCVVAQRPTVILTLSGSDEDGFVGLNDTVTFTATVRNSSEQPLSATLKWSVKTVAFDAPLARSVELKIDGAATETLTYVLPMTAVGFAEVECSMALAGGELVSQRHRVGTCSENVLRERAQ